MKNQKWFSHKCCFPQLFFSQKTTTDNTPKKLTEPWNPNKLMVWVDGSSRFIFGVIASQDWLLPVEAWEDCCNKVLPQLPWKDTQLLRLGRLKPGGGGGKRSGWRKMDTFFFKSYFGAYLGKFQIHLDIFWLMLVFCKCLRSSIPSQRCDTTLYYCELHSLLWENAGGTNAVSLSWIRNSLFCFYFFCMILNIFWNDRFHFHFHFHFSFKIMHTSPTCDYDYHY